MKAETFFGVCFAVAGITLYQRPPTGEWSILGLLLGAGILLLAFWLQSPSSAALIDAAIEILPTLNWIDPHVYDAFIAALKPKVSVKGKELFMPIRMALTGREHGPELKKLFPLLGHQFADNRFKLAKQCVKA